MGGAALGLASPTRLLAQLDFEPGTVGPSGLLNDEQRKVVVLVDTNLPGADGIGFHPNTDSATLVIMGQNMMKFLGCRRNRMEVIDFSKEGPKPLN